MSRRGHSHRRGVQSTAAVELPPRVTATEVAEKRAERASALARPLGCVWPEVNAEVHTGRLMLFVADRDMSQAAHRPWSLRSVRRHRPPVACAGAVLGGVRPFAARQRPGHRTSRLRRYTRDAS
jgi:hypothetical protein